MKFALITVALLSSIGLVNMANAASTEKGQALVEKANCASCHGAGLNAPILPAYPKLAGQYADYLFIERCQGTSKTYLYLYKSLKY